MKVIWVFHCGLVGFVCLFDWAVDCLLVLVLWGVGKGRHWVSTRVIHPSTPSHLADHFVAHIIPHHILIWPLTLQSMPIKLDLPNKLFPLGIKDDGHAGLLQLHSGEKNIDASHPVLDTVLL